jgi:multisubunit Na+/H+ antiporter MnhB subunit
VTRRKISVLLPVGLLMLSISIAMQHFTHAHHPAFLGGFLFGVSIGLLILAVARQSRRISR